MRKGEIYWADLTTDHTGDKNNHIQAGRRPVLILGNKLSTTFSSLVTILPISSKMTKVKKIPTHIVINSLKKESYVLPEQIRTISKSLIIGNCISTLSNEEQAAVDRAIAEQLGLTIA